MTKAVGTRGGNLKGDPLIALVGDLIVGARGDHTIVRSTWICIIVAVSIGSLAGKNQRGCRGVRPDTRSKCSEAGSLIEGLNIVNLVGCSKGVDGNPGIAVGRADLESRCGWVGLEDIGQIGRTDAGPGDVEIREALVGRSSFSEILDGLRVSDDAFATILVLVDVQHVAREFCRDVGLLTPGSDGAAVGAAVASNGRRKEVIICVGRISLVDPGLVDEVGCVGRIVQHVIDSNLLVDLY